MSLTPQQLESFNANGYLIVPGILSPDRTAGLVSAWNQVRIAAQAGGGSQDASRFPKLKNILTWEKGDATPVDGKVSLHIEHVFRFNPVFKDLVYDRQLLSMAESVLGKDVRLLDDQFYFKPPQTGGVTYWHRDSDFFLTVPVVTLWIPLDDVNEENGCLFAIPGSHKKSFSHPGVVSRSITSAGESTALETFHSVDTKQVECVQLAMRAGDGLLIHNDVLHCSFENRSQRERKSYLLEYFNGDHGALRKKHPAVFNFHGRERYNYLLRRNRVLNDLASAGGRLMDAAGLSKFGKVLSRRWNRLTA